MEKSTKFLPMDILYQVFSYLDCRSCGLAIPVSKSFASLGSDSRLWRSLLLHDIKNFAPLNMVDAKSCKAKFKKWITRSFQWKLVGETSLCPARYLHRSASTTSGLSYVFGGHSNQFICFNDLWRISTDEENLKIRFEKISPALASTNNHNFNTQIKTEPTPCSACAICSISEDLYIFGGCRQTNFPTFFDEFWRLKITPTIHWELLTPAPLSESPGGRWGHSMVSFNNSIYLFGGSCPGLVFNDLWMTVIDPQDSTDHVTWVKLNPPGIVPNARGGHSAVVVGHFMYIFGGNNLISSYNDIWCLNLLENHAEMFGWELIQESDSSGPSPRIGHSMIAIGRHMLIFGGRDFHKNSFCSGLYLFDTDERSWEKLSIQGMNDTRTGHCAIPCSSGILYFGGLVSETQSSSQVMHLNLFGISNEKTLSHLPQLPQITNTELQEENLSDESNHHNRSGSLLFTMIRSLNLLPSMNDVLRNVRYPGFKNSHSTQENLEDQLNYTLIEI